MQANILNEEERGKLLSALADAPDEILLDAVRQKKEWRCRIQSDFDALKGFVGARKQEAQAPQPTRAEEPQQEEEEIKKVVNKRPPGTATKSIKSATEEKISKLLVHPREAEEIRRCLSAPIEHTTNLLRLLWERGKITFDGKFYQNA